MASETVVAVFPSLSKAEAAISELVSSGVSSSSIKHYARDEADAGYDTTRSETETQHHGGFWAWLTGQETTHEHHDVYDRSIESGRTVVTVISDGSNIDQIYAVLERHDPIDLDERDAAQAGAEGYGDTGAGYAGTGLGGAAGAGSTSAGYAGTGASSVGSTGMGETTNAGIGTPGYAGTGGAGAGRTAAATAGVGPTTDAGVTGTGDTTDASRTGDSYEGRAGATGAAAGTGFGSRTAAPSDGTRTGGTEEVIPLSEESLEIGKREVNRGSTRIRRYVVERPVEEQIRLRDEAVSVFRRPARGSATVGADAFQDREVVVTETGEEAVVGKTARVVEEVVVQKGVEERVETVRDTVRREEVEIDGPAGRNVEGGPASGSKI